jgi:DNA-directed RNA polymerase specialized sigma24 family protein
MGEDMTPADSDLFLDFAANRAGHLFRYACLLTSGDTHFAEDLVQETLGRMYLTWRRIAAIDNPAGYLDYSPCSALQGGGEAKLRIALA